MPVPAAGFADLRAGDPHPLVLGRRVEHSPKQLAVASLEILALVEGLASHGDPLGQRIAHPLELFQPRDPRLARPAGNRGVDLQPRKGLRPQPRELVLEAPDLTPQLGSCKPLVASNPKRYERLSFE